MTYRGGKARNTSGGTAIQLMPIEKLVDIGDFFSRFFGKFSIIDLGHARVCLGGLLGAGKIGSQQCERGIAFLPIVDSLRTGYGLFRPLIGFLTKTGMGQVTGKFRTDDSLVLRVGNLALGRTGLILEAWRDELQARPIAEHLTQ